MEYEGQICRAPMERSAYKLPVMVGCVYNQCKFCDLFKHLKFRIIPLDEVRADILRVYEAGGRPRKIFLGDGSAFALRTEHLMQILEMIHKFFPDCSEINMNATVTSILAKSDEELRMLSDNGVKHLYIGLESGLDDILQFMNKGNTVDQLRRAALRMKEYGFCFDAHIMTGAAGHGRGAENAEATAALMIESGVTSVTNFSMFIHHETPIYKDVKEGRFIPASEYENLVEDRLLIETLSRSLEEEGDREVKYEGFHDYISFHVWGLLPRDTGRMLARLDDAIAEYYNRQDICSVIGPDDTFEILSAY